VVVEIVMDENTQIDRKEYQYLFDSMGAGLELEGISML
jgi:hypothetical protein